MGTCISNNPDETFSIGRAWASEAGAGWIIGLTGDLGAGKTQLVKGLATGLGVTERVQSPTFALINEYHGGKLPLAHIDLYRLQGRDQIIAAGLEDFLLRPRGVTVVEWMERWLGDAPPSTLRGPKHFRYVQIETVSESERRIVYEDIGA